MMRDKLLGLALLLAASVVAATSAGAQQPAAVEPALEPRAIDLLKASSSRLAGARSMTFTAVVSYENPSRLGPPLVYTAGVAAGGMASPAYAMGGIYSAPPPGCATPSINGTTYYLCGNTWFQPNYGANGVFYRVVPTP